MKRFMSLRFFAPAALLSVAVGASAQFGGQGRPPTLVPPPPGAPPGAPPLEIVKGVMGQWVRVGPHRFRVSGVQTDLRDYRQKYNQEGRVWHPGFKSDRIVAVTLEIENLGDAPIAPPVFSPAFVDNSGGRQTDWLLDARQQSFLQESRRPRGFDDRAPSMIAPGQTMKVAVVFSAAADAKPVSFEFSPRNFRDMRFGGPPPDPIRFGTSSGPATTLPNGPDGLPRAGFGGGFGGGGQTGLGTEGGFASGQGGFGGGGQGGGIGGGQGGRGGGQGGQGGGRRFRANPPPMDTPYWRVVIDLTTHPK